MIMMLELLIVLSAITIIAYSLTTSKRLPSGLLEWVIIVISVAILISWTIVPMIRSY